MPLRCICVSCVFFLFLKMITYTTWSLARFHSWHSVCGFIVCRENGKQDANFGLSFAYAYNVRVLKRNRYGGSQCSLFKTFSTSHLWRAVPLVRCLILIGQYCTVIVGIHPFVQRASMSPGFWSYCFFVYAYIYIYIYIYICRYLYGVWQKFIYTHFCCKIDSFIGSCARFQWKTQINRDPHSSMVLTGIKGGGTSCNMHLLVVQGYIPNSQGTPYFYVSLGYTSIKIHGATPIFARGYGRYW